MATIKSFSDLEQSKKLAEILPLESADMLFHFGEYKHADSIRVPLTKEHWKRMMPEVTPCWSLAALLNVVSEVSLNSFKDGDWNAMVQQNGKMIYSDANNSVDACYKMILKLHELNLL